MTTYQPPTDQQLRPGDTHAQAKSTAATYRYHPDNPINSQPPTPQASAPIPIPQHIPGAPTFAGQPITSTPPIPNSPYYGTPTSVPVGSVPHGNGSQFGTSPSYFGSSPGRMYPQTHLRPGPAVQQPGLQPQPYTPAAVPNPNYNGPPTVDPDGFMRPRRASASSVHSRHSHHSHRSGYSGASHHSAGRRDSHQPHRRHSEAPYDDDELTREERRERDRRYSEGAPVAAVEKGKRKKEYKEHRPTLGDTVYSFFGVIKDALGPRDKY